MKTPVKKEAHIMTMTLLDIMRTSAVIPVIAIDEIEHAVPLARALVAGRRYYKRNDIHISDFYYWLMASSRITNVFCLKAATRL